MQFCPLICNLPIVISTTKVLAIMSNQGDDPTPQEYQYFLEHASDTRVAGVLICTAITVFFSTFFVLLRLVGRRLTHHRWYIHISDGFLMMSWVGKYSASNFMVERALTGTTHSRFSSSLPEQASHCRRDTEVVGISSSSQARRAFTL